MKHEIDIADFAVFCRSKGAEGYDVADIQCCAFAQYAKARHPKADMGASEYKVGRDLYLLPEGGHDAICKANSRLPNKGRTFDALADRLEALIAEPVK